MSGLSYLVGSLLTMTVAFLPSSDSVERYLVKESCGAVTVNLTDNSNYVVFWDCVLLPAHSGRCMITFKNLGHYYQTCVNDKELKFNNNSQEIEILAGTPSLPHKILANPSNKSDLQHCVHNVDMVIVLKWDRICKVNSADELLVTIESTHAEDKEKTVYHSSSRRNKLILGMCIFALPFSFMLAITIYSQCMRYRRAVQLQAAVD